MKLGILTLSAMLLAIPGLVIAQEAEHGHGEEAHDMPTEAVAVLASTSDSDVKGVIYLTQKDGYVQLTGKVKNLEPGEHGFHIHQYGDLTKSDGTAAGGHYNPTGHEHGAPGAHSHVGDLGNITADASGVAKIDTKAEGLKLHMVLGRSLVIHAKADDLKSQPSGAAGPRVGVGVIGIAQPKEMK
ncbi:superoxide dismutase family protein [Blastopirellula marina]|uniref:Superoxide dismutase family protein n=1 Tax=Blastopirellula marina TaxID=124 RepID=A0A2S8FWQ9_9BACT|nr:superoxide dismutase family protein [Blastopirellula marina]PQO36616.1 superoxide dismutase family protein [Blastopirellula marina]PTL44446.1 superoxide dismutase family protein [Blastopirellula marina]